MGRETSRRFREVKSGTQLAPRVPLLQSQLHAILRASTAGCVQIIAPMIASLPLAEQAYAAGQADPAPGST
jgi:phosphoenolpyruvate-protein kinase (PTS system EI component)